MTHRPSPYPTDEELLARARAEQDTLMRIHIEDMGRRSLTDRKWLLMQCRYADEQPLCRILDRLQKGDSIPVIREQALNGDL